MPVTSTNRPSAHAAPVRTIRHRRIRAAIWAYPTQNGVMYNVTVTRSYKDGEAWRESASFGYDDLPIVAKLMYDAHSAISTLLAQDRATSSATPRPERARSK